MNPETVDLESLMLMAQIGLVLLVLFMAAYFAFLGYVVGRPSKVERAVLHRALEEASTSPDPLVAAVQRRLKHRLQPAPEN